MDPFRKKNQYIPPMAGGVVSDEDNNPRNVSVDFPRHYWCPDFSEDQPDSETLKYPGERLEEQYHKKQPGVDR